MRKTTLPTVLDSLRDLNLDDRRVDLDKRLLARALLEVADLVAELEWKLVLARTRLRQLELESRREPVRRADDGYPADWPRCPGCGKPSLDGHITCGEASCDEGGRR